MLISGLFRVLMSSTASTMGGFMQSHGEMGWGGGMGLGYIRKFFIPELNHPLSIPISPIISLFA
jgi:hypothetical protein